MSKESLQGINKKPIFRETFQDEHNTRSLGGVPTAVTYSNGVASCVAASSSKIYYPNRPLNGTYSVRIRFTSITPQANSYFIDFRDIIGGAGSGSITVGPTSLTVGYSSGTSYVDGVATSNISSSIKEIIISGMTLSSINTILNSRFSTAQFNTASYELLEIYEGTLTAQEVKNLYENDRYKALSPHPEILSGEKITNGGFDTDTAWTKVASTTIENGTANLINSNSGDRLSQNIGIRVGSMYEVTYTIVNITGGSAVIYCGGYNGTIPKSTTGTFKEKVLVVNPSSTQFVYITANVNGTSCSIDNISVKEVISNNTEILNIDGKNGTISNKYSGDINQTELVTNGSFTPPGTGWAATGESTITTGVGRVYSSTGVSATVNQNILVIGKKYHVEFDVISTDGSNLASINSTVYWGTTTTGHKVKDFTADETLLSFKRPLAGVPCDVSIDNVTCKEIVPNIVNTAVTSVRSDGINVMNFDGATSKLDCGSYDSLIGDKTFIAWIKYSSSGAYTGGRLFDNSKLLLVPLNGNAVTLLSSDGTTVTAVSASHSKYKTPFMLCVTRTSTGVTNFYINGVLSGNANQSSGTPVAGTTNLFIGNRSINDRGFDGQISGVRIINGILSVEEISQLFSNERRNYGI